MHNVMLYVEATPLRARLVTRAEDWLWSSLSTLPIHSGLVEIARPRMADWPRDDCWLKAVNQPLAAEQLNRLRNCIVRGAPHGKPQWTADYIAKAGMESTVRSRGRPRKVSDKE